MTGTVVSSLEGITRAWVEFYGNLFSAQPLNHSQQNHFLNCLTQKLTDDQSKSCEGPLTIHECKNALDAMERGKSPGLDGLPAEFYQRFWHVLGEDLVEVINYSYDNGKLPPSQRSGVISLLHKRGDRLEMKNWRPITLLCVDYKIAAKAIANRLLPVLPFVIHPDQSCGVPGRNPVENCRLLHDIVAHANKNKIGGAVVSLDQEKAFDRVEWPYLDRVIERMNFGPSFRKWVTLFYTNIFSAILINGETTNFFPVTRGVRQGCPLSPLLYVLVAESIACAIRSNPLIDGFPLPSLPSGQRAKLCQYADDTSVVVLSDQALQALFSLFDQYEQASGAKLNVTKCHGLLFGSWKARTNLPVALDWCNSAITVLGSRLANDDKEEWDPKLKDFEATMTSWKTRTLSYHGRALIINSLGLSKFWYLTSFRCLPADTIKKINTLAFTFIWQKKTEWIARASLTQRLNQGGLGVVDVPRKIASLHVLWVKRLIQNQTSPWAGFFKMFLTRAFPGRSVQQILLLPSPPRYAMNALPEFYRSVMQSWYQLTRQQSGNEIVVLDSKSSQIAISSLSAKVVYALLSQKQRTKHRCEAKYQSWGLSITWSNVWPNLLLWRFQRQIRDTSWLIAHGVLPTADRLLRFGMNVNPLCHCGKPETLGHTFTSCTFALGLVEWYYIIYKRFCATSTKPAPSEILVGYSRSVKAPPVFSGLMGIIRHQIWLTRNAARFDNVAPDLDATLRKIKSSLRFMLRIQQRHCPHNKFAELWLADGIFGRVTREGILIICDEFQ